MRTWAESKQIPGQFTGSTGVKVLTPAELSSGYQAWARKVKLLLYILFQFPFHKIHSWINHIKNSRCIFKPKLLLYIITKISFIYIIVFNNDLSKIQH